MRSDNKDLWPLRAFAAVVVLVVGARLLAPEQSYAFKQVFLLKRCGCSIPMALGSLSSQIGTDRAETSSLEASRVVAHEGAFDKWRTPAGDFWSPRYDLSLFSVLGERAEDPYNLSEWGSALRDAVVLDCGAHLGGFTRQALERGARIVVAIEPGPDQVQSLQRTFAEEIRQGRVIVRPEGVWSTVGDLSFVESGGTAGAQVRSQTEEGAIPVPVTTIDKLVADLNLPRVDFIKMDIEGAEEQALIGGRGTLARFKPRIAMAAYHRHDDSERLPAAVRYSQPSYQWRTLRCRPVEGHIHPLTLLFW